MKKRIKWEWENDEREEQKEKKREWKREITTANRLMHDAPVWCRMMPFNLGAMVLPRPAVGPGSQVPSVVGSSKGSLGINVEHQPLSLSLYHVIPTSNIQSSILYGSLWLFPWEKSLLANWHLPSWRKPWDAQCGKSSGENVAQRLITINWSVANHPEWLFKLNQPSLIASSSILLGTNQSLNIIVDHVIQVLATIFALLRQPLLTILHYPVGWFDSSYYPSINANCYWSSVTKSCQIEMVIIHLCRPFLTNQYFHCTILLLSLSLLVVVIGTILLATQPLDILSGIDRH